MCRAYFSHLIAMAVARERNSLLRDDAAAAVPRLLGLNGNLCILLAPCGRTIMTRWAASIRWRFALATRRKNPTF